MLSSRSKVAAPGTALSLFAVVVVSSCLHDSRSLTAARAEPPVSPPRLDAHSRGLCRLIGPTTDAPGVFGTDLGYTVRTPHNGEFLAVLFGDTWAKPTEGCQHPVSRHDDLQAWLPARRPDLPHSRGECGFLQYSLENRNDSVSWQPIRLFDSKEAARNGAPLNTGLLRTPVGAFSDGKHVYGIFLHGDPAYCDDTACPDGMACSTESSLGRDIGQCEGGLSLGNEPAPTFCRSNDDCAAPGTCEKLKRPLCLSQAPFTFGENDSVAPPWYESDPRRAIAKTMYIAVALGPQHPTDYLIVSRFRTNRFMNVAARAVRRFNPRDPSENDYRPGNDTLLVWGRPSFVEVGGAQSLPFLLYAPLSRFDGSTGTEFQPRFYAGYDSSGNPRWSDRESDAKPIYGTETERPPTPGQPIAWKEPEFDYVDQMTLSWVEPLEKWVMLYGGDVPAFLVTPPGSNDAREPVHLQPSPGAIHARTARHPWGRATRNASREQDWSSATPLLTRRDAAPFLACGDESKEELPGCVEDGDPNGPFDMLVALAKWSTETSPKRFLDETGECIAGEFMMAGQKEMSGNPIGRLYAPNIIEEWTEDVTATTPGLGPGEHAAAIYWNVSTWNPYQVVLFETVLRAHPGG